MNITRPFSGLTTALVTPFESGDVVNPTVDYRALERLIDMQLAAEVDNILLLGTTGENPSLSEKESYKIVQAVIEQVADQSGIIVNTGTNATNESIRYMDMYDDIYGVDGYLLVNPYYNKPTQTGLQQHFSTLASNTDRPVLLYNIEGRTGVNLETESLLEILEHNNNNNIVGVKEASGNMVQMKDVITQTPDNFTVLSGDDGLTSELIKNGGDGVVSVASNVIPGKIQRWLTNILRNNDFISHDMFDYHDDFFDALFLETNPGPVKTMLSEMGIIEDSFRLPMTQISQENRQAVYDTMKRFNIS